MKKVSLWIFFAIVFSNTYAQSFSWAKKGGLWAYDYGYGITTDNSGNVYVAGKYEKNANFSGVILPCQGNHDIFLAQYSPTGNLNWIRTAGGYTGDYAWSVACDNKFVYIAGEIEGSGAIIKFQGSPITLKCLGSNDIFLAKYTLSGNLVWARSAGGYDYDKALSITYDSSGNLYICGIYTGTATFGSSAKITGYGDKDIFIAKYDANGQFKWVRKAGSSGRDEAKSIKCDAAGNVYICGMYKTGCVFGSQVLGSPNGYFNAFIAKYTTDGNLVWVKTGGGNYDDLFWSLALDNAGKLYVGGEFNASANFSGLSISTSGSQDVLVACYDVNGNIRWVRKAGGKNADRARGLACVGSKLYITGQFGYTATFGSTTKTAADKSDIFISSLDNKGNFLWTLTAGGKPDSDEPLGYESGIAICAELSGNVFATGAMLNGATFGGTTLSPYTRTDVFVTKLTSPPAGKTSDSLDNFMAEAPRTMDSSATVERISPTVEEKKFNVYPNPNPGIFTLDLCLESAEDLEMSVYTVSGDLTDVQTLRSPCQLQLDLSDHVKGIYFIVLRAGTTAYREKVIIE